MREPSDEYLMVVDLMLELNNLNISENSSEFVTGLYHHLDPYEPFLEQQTNKQLKWLKELHQNYVKDSKW